MYDTLSDMRVKCIRAAVVLGVLIAGVLHAGRAEAQIPPIQWQLLVQGFTDVAAENPGGEVQVNIAVFGIGLALGLGGEALEWSDGSYEGGGFFDLALQFRPLMLAAAIREPYRPAYQIFDPHIDVGGLLGAISEPDGAAFRGVFFVGATLDFGIPTSHFWLDSQLLISVGYRLAPVQSQHGPWHYIVVGLGFRGGL